MLHLKSIFRKDAMWCGSNQNQVNTDMIAIEMKPMLYWIQIHHKNDRIIRYKNYKCT